VVELIDDAEAAYAIASRALRAGKPVVTANKRMIANKLPDLLRLQRETGVPFLYEAAVAGSIPILRVLEEHYANDPLHVIEGIVNGTTNYILSTMTRDRSLNDPAYAGALKDAQAKGFAESDPTMDVEGWDASFKAVLLALHAYGATLRPDQVIRRGISSVRNGDIAFARREGAVIKLLARVRSTASGLCASVLPTLLPGGDPLARVDRELNAVRLEGAFSEGQWMVGKGAGAIPTASAVLSDLSALRGGYRYAYRKRVTAPRLLSSGEWPVALLASGPFSEVDRIPFGTVLREELMGSEVRRVGTTDLLALARSPVFRSRSLFLAEVANGALSNGSERLPEPREFEVSSIH
jgi:homoserine dehydrogenase